VLDLSRLTQELKRFEQSRLHDFYRESAEPVVRFASVLARAFRAQAMIALTNTVLTLLGFWIIGLKNALLLGTIVFFFSFIPVLGVFISTTPAVLVALNQGGLSLAFLVIIVVTIIHLIEAYVLNPLIYGHHLKLNPVLVLIILFVGHHFFGLWGMLLGVPVSYYFIHYVFGVPIDSVESDTAPPQTNA
jgi:predicted PurR-regulated permease PerM